MKAGDKYIIEIENVIGSDSNPLARIKGFNALVFDQNGLDRLKKLDGVLRSYSLGYMYGLKEAEAKMADEKELPFNIGDVIMVELPSNNSDMAKAVGFYNGKSEDKYYICFTDSGIGKTYQDGTPMGTCIDTRYIIRKMVEESDNEQ